MRKKTTKVIILTGVLVLGFITGCTGTNNSNHQAAESNTMNLEASETAAPESRTVQSKHSDYQPVTITVDLERSGLGSRIEETFTEIPKHVVADGDQMADYFFDLGLEDNMAGYTHGACHSTVSVYPARDKVKLLAGGSGNHNYSKEELINLQCDFLIGWDSVFADDAFNYDFCKTNGISMYTPYCTRDDAVFEDIYKDYETLGKIFDVEELAKEKTDAMKEKLAYVQSSLGEEAYSNPIDVFVYDSGESDAFTACQGMPGDILKLAGARSVFDDIEKGWATVSWEQVVSRNPYAILVLDYNGETQEKIDFIKNNPALSNLDAVKNNRIYSACCSDMQGSAGSAGAVEIIAKSLYPDAFIK